MSVFLDVSLRLHLPWCFPVLLVTVSLPSFVFLDVFLILCSSGYWLSVLLCHIVHPSSLLFRFLSLCKIADPRMVNFLYLDSSWVSQDNRNLPSLDQLFCKRLRERSNNEEGWTINKKDRQSVTMQKNKELWKQSSKTKEGREMVTRTHHRRRRRRETSRKTKTCAS